jgi:hypothetical protein
MPLVAKSSVLLQYITDHIQITSLCDTEQLRILGLIILSIIGCVNQHTLPPLTANPAPEHQHPHLEPYNITH